ncbi:MAG: 50S ribosomal protein L24 [Candidatus Heimdallarchaeota archaeon]|nr:50S ribosomal protein L24 [Candidatus Heimdallarchaeota archaeon]
MKQTKSIQPRKQRKSHFKAEYHIRNRKMTALLSHALREKYGIRRLPIHRNDKVTVFKNKSQDAEIKGKVIRVLPQRYAVHIEGHSKEKADGTIVSFPVHPSNIVITSLNLRDKKRRAIIQRRSRKEISDEELAEDIFDEDEELAEELEDLDMLDDENILEEDFEDLDLDELDEGEEEETPDTEETKEESE